MWWDVTHREVLEAGIEAFVGVCQILVKAQMKRR